MGDVKQMPIRMGVWKGCPQKELPDNLHYFPTYWKGVADSLDYWESLAESNDPICLSECIREYDRGGSTLTGLLRSCDIEIDIVPDLQHIRIAHGLLMENIAHEPYSRESIGLAYVTLIWTEKWRMENDHHVG